MKLYYTSNEAAHIADEFFDFLGDEELGLTHKPIEKNQQLILTSDALLQLMIKDYRVQLFDIDNNDSTIKLSRYFDNVLLNQLFDKIQSNISLNDKKKSVKELIATLSSQGSFYDETNTEVDESTLEKLYSKKVRVFIVSDAERDNREAALNENRANSMEATYVHSFWYLAKVKAIKQAQSFQDFWLKIAKTHSSSTNDVNKIIKQNLLTSYIMTYYPESAILFGETQADGRYDVPVFFENRDVQNWYGTSTPMFVDEFIHAHTDEGNWIVYNSALEAQREYKFDINKMKAANDDAFKLYNASFFGLYENSLQDQGEDPIIRLKYRNSRLSLYMSYGRGFYFEVASPSDL